MTDSPNDAWENPLGSRYASAEMSSLFSARRKFATWRRLWLWLAEAERELGLAIPDEALEALRSHLLPTDAELLSADRYERETKHDVMAHVHALGDAAPAARGVIHLGATSAYVGDNADVLVLRDALALVERRLVRVIAALARFARERSDLACTGWTHFQSAQPTTVGKRACLWIQDLVLDLHEVASQGYCFQIDLAWRALQRGLRVREVPITFVERTSGASKMSRKIVVEALWRVTAWGVDDKVTKVRKRSHQKRARGAGGT